ncbi:MAG: GcrA family cell cycle regulator [Kiloniellales bacterium]
MEWSAERIETLKRMWAQGASARDIARRLGGTTRNAVIGKAYRLGLSGRAAPPPKPVPERPSRPLTNILNLTDRMCRWPSGHPDQAEFGFCGQPVMSGRPYCREHCRRAYAAGRDSAA